MKKSLPLIALIAALAAGNASAAGTLAGTSISNTASATYADPSGNPQPEVKSNTVTTTVQEVPGFTVLLAGQDSTGTPGPSGFTPAGIASAKPGDTVSFKYTLTNTGNVADTYTLGAQSPFSFKPDGSVGASPINIKYYAADADANNDGVLTVAESEAATPITSLTSVSPDDPNTTGDDGSSVNFFAIYTVPSTAEDTTRLGTSPVVTGGKATTPDNNNYNQTTVSRTDAGLIGPFRDANANGNIDGTTNPVTNYTSAEGRTIDPSADSQTAAVPYSTNAQTISFTNTVQNTGNRNDTFNIGVPSPAQLDAAGFPVGTTAALFLVDAAGANPTALTDTNSDGKLDVGSLAPNASVNIRVVVSLPAGARPDSPTTVPAFTLTATSSNTTANVDATTNRVQLAGVDFGDRTVAPGTSSAPATEAKGNPDTAVYLPMDVYNAGNLADTFTLSGSVVLPLKTGGTQTVEVKYYVDSDGDGVLSAAEKAAGAISTTPSIASGSELKVIGEIQIPKDAASTITSPTVTQTATSTTTGATASDTNDTVTVGKTGDLGLKKFVDTCGKTNVCPAAPLFTDTPANNGAKPGDVLRYTVIAKNGTNNTVHILSIKDTLPANTTFVSVTGTSTATGMVYYRVNGGAWSTAMPSSLTAGQSVEVSIDTNGNGGIDTGDRIAVDGELRMDFRVRIN